MPNWCYTNIKITHKDEDKVKNLESLLEEWTSKNYMENGFGHKWLGNIVLGSGIGTVDTGTETDVRCRGNISYIDRFDNELTIDTETAWGPMMSMWTKIIDKYLPGAEIIYVAEESGCDLFCTNDMKLKNHYYIDSYEINEIESEYEASEEYVIEVLQKLLNTTESNIDILLKMFWKSDLIDSMSIHKWDFADINGFD